MPHQTRLPRSSSAEHQIPSTTGKLSEGTLKELLLAQEQDQPTAAVAGTPKAER